MALWLFLIFVGLPILEIVLFIEVGGAIGLLPTLGIVLLSAVAGVALMRLAGDAGAGPAAGEPGDRRRPGRADRARGADPGGGGAAGAAGVLHRRARACLLLIPPVRALLIRWGASRVTVRAATYVRPAAGGPARGRPETIEADYEVVEDAAAAAAAARAGRGRSRDARESRCGSRTCVLDPRPIRDETGGRIMAEETNGTAPARPAAAQPRLQILTQYVRDLSFENIAAQKGARLRRASPTSGCR